MTSIRRWWKRRACVLRWRQWAHIPRSDREALRSDWEAVGADLWMAISVYEKGRKNDDPTQ